MIFDAWNEACALWRAAMAAEKVERAVIERVFDRAQRIHRDAFYISVLGDRPYSTRFENGQAHVAPAQFVSGAIEAAIRKHQDSDDDCC